MDRSTDDEKSEEDDSELVGMLSGRLEIGIYPEDTPTDEFTAHSDADVED